MIPFSALPIPVKSVHLTNYHIEVGIFPGSFTEPLHSKFVDLLPQCIQSNGCVRIIFIFRYIIIKVGRIFVLLQLTFQYSFKFCMLSSDYEKEQAELEEVIAADVAELEVFTTDKDRAQQFLSIAKRYTDFSQLTTPMINEFVDKILVHAPEKIDGERTMEIEIYLKFIGKFDIPMPEPTPEELAAEEKAKKKRAAERAKYERRKERKRQQKLEAERQAEAAENADAPEE